MIKLRPTQIGKPQPLIASLLVLILPLALSGCGPNPTPSPTDVPPPTNTPDPNVEWPRFSDPWGRFSVHHPPDWHTFPAVLAEPGYASAISTINIGAMSEPSRELDVSGEDFVIWFSMSSPDPSVGSNLGAWAQAQLHPGGIVVQRTEETIAGAPAVVEILDLFNGQQAKLVHFSTSNGILTIFGQPWGNAMSDSFDLLLTTVAFQ